MRKAFGYAAQTAKSPIAPFQFERRDPGPNDVVIQILYCGVCHSDIHQARDEWGGSIFPMVPGHEIVGRVVEMGKSVTKFKLDEMAAVGCYVDSCRHCPSCLAGEQNLCYNKIDFTYNSLDKAGAPIYGGYSNFIVVDQMYALKVSPDLDPAAAAPLLCAGITTWSPLTHWNIGKGSKVGVVGLGGLGHMALKFGHALGAHVVQFTTSPGKAADAKRLGADEVVNSKDPDAMQKYVNTFDMIVDTVSADHDLNAFVALLNRDGNLCMVGLPEKQPSISCMLLVMKRRMISGSCNGGLKETQEMLDYCAKHNIVSDIEIIPIQKINEAYTRMLNNDVKYRFVIDLASLPKS
jgi:uncharacterized zinc-type alcohol dehydrogenase-like protein